MEHVEVIVICFLHQVSAEGKVRSKIQSMLPLPSYTYWFELRKDITWGLKRWLSW